MKDGGVTGDQPQAACAAGAATTPSRALTPGILYNGHSGRHRKRWAQPPADADMPAVAARTDAEIRAGLQDLAARGVELLAVAGGDGTVQAVLTHIMLGGVFARPPLLALVPTGSTNMTGNDVGTLTVRRDGWQRLRAWAADPQRGAPRIVRREVLQIDPGGGAAPFCGMFFGAGAVYSAVEHTQRRLHQYGMRGDVGPGVAFGRFIKAVATGDRRYFPPVDVCIRDERGLQHDGANILLLASTLERLVLRLHPFWGREAAPVGWSAIADGAAGFLRRIPAVCRGRRKPWMTADNGYRSHNSRRVELSFDGGYIVDGEFFCARRAHGPVVLSSAGQAAFVTL